MSTPAPAVAHVPVASHVAPAETDRIKPMTMPRTTHSASGLQEALRSAGKGSWKLALVPLGLGLLILIAMVAVAFSSH